VKSKGKATKEMISVIAVARLPPAGNARFRIAASALNKYKPKAAPVPRRKRAKVYKIAR